jgi:hypothetical protein
MGAVVAKERKKKKNKLKVHIVTDLIFILTINNKH